MNIIEFIARPDFMAILGFVAHVIKKIMRVRRDGHLLTPLGYFVQYPYQSIFALIGAIAGVGALHATGMLNAVSAFSAGYMANSVADMLGKRGKREIEGQ